MRTPSRCLLFRIIVCRTIEHRLTRPRLTALLTVSRYIRTWDATASSTMRRPSVASAEGCQNKPPCIFDGLGRNIQQVVKQGSLPIGVKDLLQAIVYDEVRTGVGSITICRLPPIRPAAIRLNERWWFRQNLPATSQLCETLVSTTFTAVKPIRGSPSPAQSPDKVPMPRAMAAGELASDALNRHGIERYRISLAPMIRCAGGEQQQYQRFAGHAGDYSKQ